MRMNRRLPHLIFFPLSVLLGWGVSLSQAHAQGKMSPVPTGLGKEFASETAGVNGITLHYVHGGKGPAVFLIHGFPQDWFEYHDIMPRSPNHLTLIAITLPAFSSRTPT